MKRLYGALAMLLVSAVLLATSSFAWFSMNTTVSVTGLEITAKSDSVYLLIGTGTNDTASEIQAAKTTSVELVIDNAGITVHPSAHTSAVTNSTSANNPSNWFYKLADEPDASESTKEANVLTSENYLDYVIHSVCYITVAKGSNPAANLVVDEVTVASNGSASGASATFAPVKILVATSYAAAEFSQTVVSSNTVLADEVTDDSVVQIDVFIYYDGEDEAVFTNNTANLDGAQISIKFAVD